MLVLLFGLDCLASGGAQPTRALSRGERGGRVKHASEREKEFYNRKIMNSETFQHVRNQNVLINNHCLVQSDASCIIPCCGSKIIPDHSAISVSDKSSLSHHYTLITVASSAILPPY